MLPICMLKPLTSLRFVAAFVVFAQHCGIGTLGGTAVSFFFVLSGFIITYSYADRLKVWDNSAIRRFLILRATRLFPVHLFTMFGAIIISGNGDGGIFDVIVNALLLQSFRFAGPGNFAFNGAAWSISDEMFFYAVTPLLLFIAYKIGVYRSHNAFIAGLAVFFSLVIVCWAIGSNFAPFSVNWWLIYIFPPIRLLDYMIGMCLGLVFKLSEDKSRFKLGLIGGTVAELGALIFLALSIRNISMMPFPAMSISAAYLPAFCLVIYFFARSEGFITKLASHKILVHLGEVSFSFYMVHTLVIISLGKFFGPSLWFPDTNSTKLYAFGFAAIVTLSLSDSLYRYIELPFRKQVGILLK